MEVLTKIKVDKQDKHDANQLDKLDLNLKVVIVEPTAAAVVAADGMVVAVPVDIMQQVVEGLVI